MFVYGCASATKIEMCCTLFAQIVLRVRQSKVENTIWQFANEYFQNAGMAGPEYEMSD